MTLSTKNSFASIIVPMLVEKLVKKDEQFLEESLNSLIERNHKLGGPVHGFLFMGGFHTDLKNAVSKAAAEKKHIHPDLIPEAITYVNELKEHEKQKQRLTHGLSLVLLPCQNWQDARDALPDILKNDIDQMSKLKRTREEAFTLENDFQRHEYQSTLNLIEFYYANRIL